MVDAIMETEISKRQQDCAVLVHEEAENAIHEIL